MEKISKNIFKFPENRDEDVVSGENIVIKLPVRTLEFWWYRNSSNTTVFDFDFDFGNFNTE